MTKVLCALAVALAAMTMAGCSACDFPLYWPQSCRSAPPPVPDAPPPTR